MKKISTILMLLILVFAIVSCTEDSDKCNHKYGEWVTVSESTCSVQGKQVRVCPKCQHTEENNLELLAHTEAVLEAVEPTCIGEGLTEGKYCSICNTVIEPQQSILPNGHSFVNGVCSCGAQNNKRQIILSSVTASAGDTVSITVAVSGNPGIASLILALEFDNSALKLEKITYNNNLDGVTMLPEENESPVKLYWINAFSNQEGDFVLATLTFKISDIAPKSNYNITLTYNSDNVYNINEENVYFETVNGRISVS